jgi:Protein of unknown function (DUF3089)
MAKRRRSPATKFLWIVAILTMLFIAGALLFNTFYAQLVKWTLIPSSDFRDVPMPNGSAYSQPAMWIARPDIGGNPSLWHPREVPNPPAPRAAIFFVHPTSFLERGAWNAPIQDNDSRWRAGLFVRSQASAFNSVGAVWAPRYRQATFGAFLTDTDNARRALDFAYRDVLASYEEFVRQAPRDRPIILAGHSQGSFHLMRLLLERIKGSPELDRIAAVYMIGWPLSTSADLPFMPLPACTRAGQAHCILSWMSFGEPADPALIVDTWEASNGPTGIPRRGTPMLCVNPLTGNAGDAAPAEANRGTLIPNEDLTDAEFRAQVVPARCDERGFLLIGSNPPAMGGYVLPGNNYHVYDYTLFWANIRADAEARLATFVAR